MDVGGTGYVERKGKVRPLGYSFRLHFVLLCPFLFLPLGKGGVRQPDSRISGIDPPSYIDPQYQFQ